MVFALRSTATNEYHTTDVTIKALISFARKYLSTFVGTEGCEVVEPS